MSLLSNSVRLSPFPHLGGASVYTAERNVYWSSGQRKTFAYGEARIANVTNRAAVPEGYSPPYCHSMPQKGGGMASRGRIAGAGDVSPPNLAGGLNAEAPLSGSGDITDAALGLILSAVASIGGSGSLTAGIAGKLEAAASLIASGDIAAALGAIAGLVSDITASGTASADIEAKASISADIDVADTGVTLTANDVATAVWGRTAEGAYSYADLVRILAAVAAGQTTIVDNGNGTATVTFRDVNDTKDRVVAEMTGSERVSLTLDGDQ